MFAFVPTSGCQRPLSDVPPIKARDAADRLDATGDDIDARFGPVVSGEVPGSPEEKAALNRKTNSLRAIADGFRDAAAGNEAAAARRE